jgi:hypothetical protein
MGQEASCTGRRMIGLTTPVVDIEKSIRTQAIPVVSHASASLVGHAKSGVM